MQAKRYTHCGLLVKVLLAGLAGKSVHFLPVSCGMLSRVVTLVMVCITVVVIKYVIAACFRGKAVIQIVINTHPDWCFIIYAPPGNVLAL